MSTPIVLPFAGAIVQVRSPSGALSAAIVVDLAECVDEDPLTVSVVEFGYEGFCWTHDLPHESEAREGHTHWRWPPRPRLHSPADEGMDA